MAKVHRHVGEPTEMDWEGVLPKEYKASDAMGVIGKVIIGPQDGEPNYYVRYFRVEPGGQTALDQHEHDHGVFILHGQAEVRLGEDFEVVNPNDIVYIAGNDVHQFRALGSEPLGFLCIVPPRKR